MFGLGCAAGMAAGMILTSKSGREATKFLRSKADEGAKTVKDTVDHLSEAVTGAATRGMKAVKYQAENVEAALEAGKKAFKNAQEMTP
jgi:gas vesicle protein